MAFEDDKKSKDGSRKWDIGSRNDKPAEDTGPNIEELLTRAEPLIEQVNTLYNQFVTGVESLPPNERRKQLEHIMMTLRNVHLTNLTYKFRISTAYQRFATLRDKWDRLLRDLETGKIKRITGPKKG